MSPVLPHESPEMHVDLGDRVFAAKVPALEARPGESVESFRSRISDTAWAIHMAVMKIIQDANAGNAAAPETRTRVTVNYYAAAPQADTAPGTSMRDSVDRIEAAARKVRYGTVTEPARPGRATRVSVQPEGPGARMRLMSHVHDYRPVRGDRVAYVSDVILGKAPDHRA